MNTGNHLQGTVEGKGCKMILNAYLQSNIQARGGLRFVHCPEIVDLYFGSDIENEMLNQKYKFVKQKRKQLFANGDFAGFVWYTERPYRLDAFLKVIDACKFNSKNIAELFLEIWADSELPCGHNFKIWRDLFSAFKDNRVLENTKKHLPERFKVWRGGSPDGISWTLDENIARKFSERKYRRTKMVQCREITRDEVICYLDGRGEKEIILL